jgi:CheY-like chemotaxis protein
MHTPVVSAPYLNSLHDPKVLPHKEYGEVSTVCTQCKRVLLSSLKHGGVSIRISRDEDDQWINPADFSVPYSNCLSHGLCGACFSRLDAKLLSIPSSYPPSIPSSYPPSTTIHTSAIRTNKSILNKSSNSPQISRISPPSLSLPRPLRVLVVDDNRFQRQIHKRMVEQAGFVCDVAVSGEEAVEMARKTPYSLILMDLVMKTMDGWTTSRKIRMAMMEAVGVAGALPKIVAVTGLQVDEKMMQKCKGSGMEEVMQKPVSPSLLHKVLTQHAGQR